MPTDITSQLQTATAPVTLQAGDYSISQNVTLGHHLTMLPGATITVPAGVTLKLISSLDAAITQLFKGAGLVDLNKSRIATAYAEWWGAKSNDGTFDNKGPLSAAVAGHPNVELLAADYFINSTWKIAQSHRTVRGAGPRWSPGSQGTRIVLQGGSSHVMQVGTDTKPSGAIENFVTAVHVSNLSLWRSAAPVSPAAGQEANGPSGLRAQYLLYCQFEDVQAPEHSIGFSIAGCVASQFRRCTAFRSTAGSGTGNNIFFGFYLNGHVNIGLAGGNASVYLIDCAASVGGAPPLSSAAGMLLDGAFVDTFVIRFETTTIAKGIVAFGVSASTDPALRKAGNLDLHIHMPILDQCSDRGIEMGNLSNYAAVELIDPYVALAPGALAALHLHDGGGNVTLSGGQFIGYGNNEAGGVGLGLLAEAQKGIRAVGTKILGMARPVGMNACTAFDIAVDVSNPDQNASQAAIRLEGCDRGRIVSFVRGKAGAFPQGVSLVGTGNGHVFIDATGLDPASLTGGAGEKVRIAGSQVTTVGPVGTHYVTGVMS
jgi:hypothetical protein